MIRAGLPLLLTLAAFGQSARTFEVASVKVHEGPMRRLGVTIEAQRLTCDACNARTLVMFAYNLKNFQVDGAAPLLNDDTARWDVVAKATGESIPTRDEFREMLQALLADRFQLKAHRETRPLDVYALVVAKNGPKLKSSDPDADPTQHYSLKGRNNFITMPKAGMTDVVDAVDNAMLDHPVVDQTGLTGTYNVVLTYTPNRWGEPAVDDLSVFQAVQEQLGLKLEPRKAPVEIVVIDSVARPSAN